MGEERKLNSEIYRVPIGRESPAHGADNQSRADYDQRQSS